MPVADLYWFRRPAASMAFTPILASDTTAAFLLPLVILFWIGIGGGTLAGLLALALYGCKRVKQVWGIMLGALSIAVGMCGLLFLVGIVDGEWWVWADVLTPLVVGILDVIIWKSRKYEN